MTAVRCSSTWQSRSGLGATSVGGAVDVLRQSRAVLQTVASSPTVWRAFEELDAAALAKIAKVRAAHRRAIWARLAARPGGFPWVDVAGQVWQGWIVLDVDASLVESHSDKEGAAPTYKKHPAPRSALSYSQFSWEEFGGTFLGLMAYSDPKGRPGTIACQ